MKTAIGNREAPAHGRLVTLLVTVVLTTLPLRARASDADPTGAHASPGSPTNSVTAHAPSADEALHRLIDGNHRFVDGKAAHPDQSSERRVALAKGQSPFAIVLTCSDSRVAPEIYFDQGLGDLFVIRNAGNILDDHVLGSIEYAAEHLHAPLIVVVGHAKCGAVSAAVAGGSVPGHIHSIVESIAPAVAETRRMPGDKLDSTVRANALLMAKFINHSEPILKPAAEHGHLKVVAAYYDLATGKIEILH